MDWGIFVIGFLGWIDRRLAVPVYEAIMPLGPEFPSTGGEYVVEIARTETPVVVIANVVAIVVISLLPPLLIGRLRFFQSLDRGERELCLERMQFHKIYAVRLSLNIAKMSALLLNLPHVSRARRDVVDGESG